MLMVTVGSVYHWVVYYEVTRYKTYLFNNVKMLLPSLDEISNNFIQIL